MNTKTSFKVKELMTMDFRKPITELTERIPGKWRFINNYCLVFDQAADGEKWHYEIDLERCKTADDVFGWIAQLSGKRWATAEVIGDFALKVNKLLGLYSIIQQPELYKNSDDLKSIVDENIEKYFK